MCAGLRTVVVVFWCVWLALVVPAAAKLPAAAEGASASKLRSLGENAMVAGRYDEAAELYTKVIQVEPDDARNYYKLFRVHLRQLKYKNAVKDLSNAVEVNPEYTIGHIQLGKLQMKLGRCDEAVYSLKKALSLDANNEKATKSLPDAEKCAAAVTKAKQSLQRRDYLGAERNFGEALEVASSSADLYLQKVSCPNVFGLGIRAFRDVCRTPAHDNNAVFAKFHACLPRPNAT